MEATHDQPGSCRARPVIADDDLEDIRWIRGVGGEELPTASYALLPNLKKVLCSSPKPEERPFFAIGEGSRILVACLRRSSTQMCWNQTPGRRPPPVTGRFMNTVVTRGWARAPDERPPFRFHGAVVDFVHRCLSRTRNLADSSKHLAEFFSGRSWPKISPRFFFSGFLKSLKLFLSRFVPMARGTEIVWRVFMKFQLFWKHHVSIVTGIQKSLRVMCTP